MSVLRKDIFKDHNKFHSLNTDFPNQSIGIKIPRSFVLPNQEALKTSSIAFLDTQRILSVFVSLKEWKHLLEGQTDCLI